MRYTSIILILLFFIGCKEHSNKSISIIQDKDTFNNNVLLRKANKYLPDTIYRFDSNAIVNGCTNVYLQKISSDLQNELFIDLDFDRIPKYKELDITKYSKFIHISFNKYIKNNKYVDPVCNDAPRYPKDWQKPIKYIAIAGSLKIIYWSDNTDIVSATTTNLIVQDSSGHKIIIPYEMFEKLRVHWKGG